MKIIALLACGFVLVVSNVVVAAPIVNAKSVAPAEQKTIGGFKDVPKGHWAYEATNRLCDCGIIEAERVNRSVLLSRYEFAILLGRIVKTQQANARIERKDIVAIVAKRFEDQRHAQPLQKMTSSSKEASAEILIALCTEFETELNILGVDYRSWQPCFAPIEKRSSHSTKR